MGVSTDGQICYGVLFDEDYEFPWIVDGDNDVDTWWRNKHGFTHSFELYDSEGNYLNGVNPSKEQISAYYAEERSFDAANPLPVEVVNYCSCDFPMYILAVPSSTKSARRGYPEEFDPAKLTVTEQEKADLLKFCEENGLAFVKGPAWFLSSLWC